MTERRQCRVWQAATRAMTALQERDLLPTAEAYSVWLAYFRGSHPALTEALQSLIDGQDTIDDGRCQELYDQFIGPERYEQRLHRAGGRMEQLAGQLIDAAAALCHGAARCASTLDAASAGVGAATDPRQLARLVASILDEMAIVRRQGGGLQTRLEQDTH